MTLTRRVGIFLAPIILAAVCKATIASATGGADFAVYENEPVKIFDLSIDLLLTATAVLLGVLLYVTAGGITTKPGSTDTILPRDLVVCGFVQITALVLIFGSAIGLPHITFIRDEHLSLATVWAPDLFGFFAFLWVIMKLT